MNCIASYKDDVKVIFENGKSVRFKNVSKTTYQIGKIDGCLITDHRKRCDYFLRTREKIWLVELKGKNVDHAIEQIVQTTHNLTEEISDRTIIAVIIASKCPAISGIQKSLLGFKKCNKRPSDIVLKSRMADIDI